MKLRGVAWSTFRLPYVATFATAHEQAAAREGLFLRLVADDGLEGLGEASPVAAFGGGTLADVLKLLDDLAPRLVGLDLHQLDLELHRLPPDRAGVAALACALDTALCDLRARREGRPLARLLGGDPCRPLPVNATIGALETAAAARAAERAVAAGFDCLKLKVGLAPTPEQEAERVGAVRAAAGPSPRLRLDANGAWSPEQAVATLRALAPFDLELVEQPVPALDLAGLAQVRSMVEVPIAADESVGGPEQARRVIEAGAADLLVVKPMLAGGPRPALAVLELAAAAGLQAFVTTTIDAGVGVAAAVHLATLLPEPPLACGLATTPLLVDDLTTPRCLVERGWVHPPRGPGLGVAIDEARRRRHAGPWRTAGPAFQAHLPS